MTKTNDPKDQKTQDPEIWTPEIFVSKVRDKTQSLIGSSLETLEDLETLEIEDPEDLINDPETGRPGRLDRQTAGSLEYGDILYHLWYVNSDGSPQRYKVNGRPQIWKTRPEEIRIPAKRGLWQYVQIWHYDLDQFSLSESFASLDHNKETETDRLIKTLESSISSLQSHCILIGDHIRDFESDSGHTWIRPERLTEDQTETLETFSRVSRSLSIFLSRIVSDLRYLADLKESERPGDRLDLETLRSSHVYLEDLYNDPETWSQIGEETRELTRKTAGSLLTERPDKISEIIPCYTDPEIVH